MNRNRSRHLAWCIYRKRRLTSVVWLGIPVVWCSWRHGQVLQQIQVWLLFYCFGSDDCIASTESHSRYENLRSTAAKVIFTTNRNSVLSSHSGCHHGVENAGSSTALRCSNSVVRVDFEATMAAEYLDKSIAEGFSQHSQE